MIRCLSRPRWQKNSCTIEGVAIGTAPGGIGPSDRRSYLHTGEVGNQESESRPAELRRVEPGGTGLPIQTSLSSGNGLGG
jgi:hypothetical protein